MGKESPERPKSPDWMNVDPAERDWRDILKKSRDPEQHRKDLEQFKRNPRAYDLLRSGAEWATIEPGKRKWMPVSAKRVMVLTGMGNCVGIIAFTTKGALAEHLPIQRDGSLKGLPQIESEMRAFAAELRRQVLGAKGRGTLHLVHARDEGSMQWAGAYETFLTRELGGVAGRFQRHVYDKPGRYLKSRTNVVVDPETKTVQILPSWMREADHLYNWSHIREGDRKWYPGFDREVFKGLRLDERTPDLQMGHEHPHLSLQEQVRLYKQQHTSGYFD